jgi:eukaryotic-like serine/threonine-protein kinase
MHAFKRYHLFTLFPCLLLLLGSISCANAIGSTTVAAAPPATGANSHKPSTNTTSAAAKTTATTSCPTSGKGRAASLSAITLGSQQEIVFYRNHNSTATLREFDVQDKTSSIFATLAGESIESAQLSQSGQWALFVAQQNGVQELQLIRVDGHDLQTLYCASTGQKLEAQQSPNQLPVL